jgi:hypothetical protein
VVRKLAKIALAALQAAAESIACSALLAAATEARKVFSRLVFLRPL